MSAIFPELPATLGIYSLTRRLVAYEHSEVYLAAQSYVDRMVVLEVLRPECGVAEQVEFREAVRHRTAARLPMVSPVLDSAQTDRLRYLVQEQPAGQPLPDYVAEHGPLSTAQAFALVQAVADVYEACREQGLAARPFVAESIYTDGEQFCFFSPVVAGAPGDEQRTAQMTGLADILEQSITPADLKGSTVAVVVHWLRRGYGGVLLEWGVLASLLRKRRMRSGADKPSWRQRLSALLENKHRLHRLLRTAGIYVAIVAGMVAVVLTLGALGAAYKWDPAPARPAVSRGYVYCRTEAGQMVRIQSRPVSVAEYEQFLDDLKRMSPAAREALYRDLPVSSRQHTPADWTRQVAAARTDSAAVTGVSYEDALVYARYAGGELPSAALVHTARNHATGYRVEEWTSTAVPAIFPDAAYRVVLPAPGQDTIVREPNDLHRSDRRGFRLCFR